MGTKTTLSQAQREKRQKKNRRIRVIVGIILLIVAVTLIVCVVYFFTRDDDEGIESAYAADYESVMADYYEAILTGNGGLMASIMAPPDYWTYYLTTYDKSEDDVIDEFSAMCNGIVADWEETYGAPVTLSYQILAESTPAAEGLDEWDEDMAAMVGNHSLDILDAVTLEVVLTVTGSDSHEDLTYYPTIVQMADGWYMLEEDSETLQAAS